MRYFGAVVVVIVSFCFDFFASSDCGSSEDFEVFWSVFAKRTAAAETKRSVLVDRIGGGRGSGSSIDGICGVCGNNEALKGQNAFTYVVLRCRL